LLLRKVTMTDEALFEGSAPRTILYIALELSAAKWLLAFGDGSCRKPRLKSIDAGDLDALAREIVAAKVRLKLPASAEVVSCYEAGRDGFWIHRALESRGVKNYVVDAASIEVNRRHRRAKTDAIDAAGLLRLLVRFENGDRDVWRIARVPSERDEDARRTHRERERLKKERNQLRNRIFALLATQGLKMEPTKLPELLKTGRSRDGRELGPALVAELLRMHERLALLSTQLKTLEKQQQTAIVTRSNEPSFHRIARLMCLRGIGLKCAWPLVMEFFSWRHFRNRRELGALSGLTGTPYDSGGRAREQGISKAGNKRVRWVILETAWLWLHHQPDSALTRWFRERFGKAGKRSMKVGIVALARKLLVALWHYLEHGVIPEGVSLSASPGVAPEILEAARTAGHDARHSPRMEGVGARAVARLPSITLLARTES
jgi:transposase